MFEYDYCFCTSEKCEHTECFRHRSRMPTDIPITVSNFEKDKKMCEASLLHSSKRAD